MIALLLSALLFQSAQAGTRWDEAVMALAPGSELRVGLGIESTTGVLTSVATNGIVIRVGGREIKIERANISSIERRGVSHRKRNAAIGFALGLGAGFVLYAKKCNDSCMSEGASFITAPLSAAGAAMGAIAPTRSWITVYRR
jgi:hypothetical protein